MFSKCLKNVLRKHLYKSIRFISFHFIHSDLHRIRHIFLVGITTFLSNHFFQLGRKSQVTFASCKSQHLWLSKVRINIPPKFHFSITIPCSSITRQNNSFSATRSAEKNLPTPKSFFWLDCFLKKNVSSSYSVYFL